MIVALPVPVVVVVPDHSNVVLLYRPIEVVTDAPEPEMTKLKFVRTVPAVK